MARPTLHTHPFSLHGDLVVEVAGTPLRVHARGGVISVTARLRDLPRLARAMKGLRPALQRVQGVAQRHGVGIWWQFAGVRLKRLA